MLVLDPAAQDGVAFAHGGLFPQTWWGSLKEREMEPAFNISTQGWKLKQDMNFRKVWQAVQGHPGNWQGESQRTVASEVGVCSKGKA